MKLYFASPFFNPEQVEREERLKAKLRRLGFEVWSPKENSICPPTANKQTRAEVFKDNVQNILNSDAVFVVTNGKDMGTIFEAGLAYQANKPIIYYCEGLNGPFNLMLAESGQLVLTNDDFDAPMIIDAILGTTTDFKGEIE